MRQVKQAPCGAQVGVHGDLARLGLVEGTPPPSPVAQLYDWDLATAALAAAHAVSRELRAAVVPAPSSFQPPPPQQLAAPALQRPGEKRLFTEDCRRIFVPPKHITLCGDMYMCRLHIRIFPCKPGEVSDLTIWELHIAATYAVCSCVRRT